MREKDIRPAALFSTYLKLCEEDAKLCFSNSSSQDVPCPACDSHKSTKDFVKWGFGYSVCASCGTLFQTPRNEVGAFQKFYTESRSSNYWTETFYPAVAESRREKLFKPKAAEILELAKEMPEPPESIIDIGAGFGILLEELRALHPDSEYIALEPNHEMADICRSKGLNVIEAFAEHESAASISSDIAIALEVLEHVHEPVEFCSSVHAMLKPHGRALFTTLTCDGFDIRTLWEKSQSVSPPHHLNFMSIEGLTRLMERAGFSKVHVFTPGKLDLDIVAGAVENGTLPNPPKVVEALLSLDEQGKSEFQTFLQRNRLSSHCWVWAER